LEGQPQVSPWPHPYIWAGADLNGGGGYQPLSYIVGGGFQNESHWGFFFVEGMFDGSKKVNDNTGQNSGYTERAHMFGGFKYKDWMYGTGISYSLLHTSLYSKDAWHPRLGLGKDLDFMSTDCRLYAEYVFPGTDTLNAVQGVEFSVFWPSIRDRSRHLFFRERFAAYEFHQTFTDIKNNQIRIQQQNNRSVFNELQLTVMYRF